MGLGGESGGGEVRMLHFCLLLRLLPTWVDSKKGIGWG